MKFEQYAISPIIKENLKQLGFKKPTDIQFKAIPSILKGDDVLAIAQTGTGKTAAFAIPLVHIILSRKPFNKLNQIKALVMVPTRELALQIAQVFHSIAAHTPLTCLGLVGGLEQEQQINILKKGVDILIATPGRMFDLVSQKMIDLSRVDILVLDEADRMLDMGFNKDIQDVLKLLPKRHQTLFFSATINEKIKKLSYSIVQNPIRIQISPKDPVSKNIQHALLFVEMDDKRFFLERFAKEYHDKKILVFVRTKVRAERVAAAMKRVNIDSLTMHGDKDQTDRLKTLKAFREGSIPLLIATDLSARGIDIPGIDMVINYDIPDNAENYVHRIGRTGRGREKGKAISFCSQEEKTLIQDIERFMNKAIPVMEWDRQSYLETIVFTDDVPNHNWQLLIDEADKEEKTIKKKKSKK